MRILFLTLSRFSSFPAYKRAVGMGEALATRGCEVAIATLDCEENRERMTNEAPHCRPLWFKGGVWREILGKVTMIWRWHPDVVYSTSYSVHNLAFLRWMLPVHMKYVVEFCELYSQYPRRRLNWGLWEMLALYECSHVLCASQYLKRHFVAICKRIGLRRHVGYQPYAYPDYLRPERNAVGGDRPSIVFMASMSREYGVYEVLCAFEMMHLRCGNCQLELIGGGPEKNAVQNWVHDHELDSYVNVRGFVPERDLNGYFSRAAVFVSPMHDTVQDVARCPSKLYYYLPYQKPIVTCRIGNPYEVLGRHGYYYRPNDTEDMAKTFQHALDGSATFRYPDGFLDGHSWMARAKSFEEWMDNE